MAEQMRALGAMVITQPTPTEMHYEMAVRLTRDELYELKGYALHPWITLTANLDTEKVELGAGITAKKLP